MFLHSGKDLQKQVRLVSMYWSFAYLTVCPGLASALEEKFKSWWNLTQLSVCTISVAVKNTSLTSHWLANGSWLGRVSFEMFICCFSTHMHLYCISINAYVGGEKLFYGLTGSSEAVEILTCAGACDPYCLHRGLCCVCPCLCSSFSCLCCGCGRWIGGGGGSPCPFQLQNTA